MSDSIFYIIMGPPGAGKGTQSQLLAKELHLPHVSSGDLFRSAIKASSPIGIEAKEYIDKGQLVPDDLVWKIVRERISSSDCSSGCIIDGFPRNLAQANLLNEFLREKQAKYRVIHLDVSEEEIIRRIHSRFICPSCHLVYNEQQNLAQCSQCHSDLIRRSDDTLDVVLKRLGDYKRTTSSLIHYYHKLGKLLLVPSKPSPQEVFDYILDCIEV